MGFPTLPILDSNPWTLILSDILQAQTETLSPQHLQSPKALIQGSDGVSGLRVWGLGFRAWRSPLDNQKLYYDVLERLILSTIRTLIVTLIVALFYL